MSVEIAPFDFKCATQIEEKALKVANGKNHPLEVLVVDFHHNKEQKSELKLWMQEYFSHFTKLPTLS